MRSSARAPLALLALVLAACGADEPDAPPPPPAPSGPPTVTLSASSTPPGATVSNGGHVLGVTPLSTPVPLPATPPGQPAQTYRFDIALAGYETAQIDAAPVNGAIAISATLAPHVEPEAAAAPAPVAAATWSWPEGAERVWRGRWGAQRERYALEVHLTRRGGAVDGHIAWTPQHRSGSTEREFVRGRYDAAAGRLNFAGYRVSNPRELGMDSYRLNVAADGRLSGRSRSNAGDWSGRFDARPVN